MTLKGVDMEEKDLTEHLINLMPSFLTFLGVIVGAVSVWLTMHALFSPKVKFCGARGPLEEANGVTCRSFSLRLDEDIHSITVFEARDKVTFVGWKFLEDPRPAWANLDMKPIAPCNIFSEKIKGTKGRLLFINFIPKDKKVTHLRFVVSENNSIAKSSTLCFNFLMARLARRFPILRTINPMEKIICVDIND